MLSENSFKLIDLASGGIVCHNDLPPLVLAIGNFDGVHLGHRRLIERAVELSSENCSVMDGKTCESGVFCFSTPPADSLLADPPRHICTLDDKLELFRGFGVRYAVVAEFDDLCKTSPQDFVLFLKNRCKCVSIVCGFNFKFGRGGAGTPEDLIKAFPDSAHVIPPVKDEEGITISSSRIRALLQDGDAERATRLLGRPFFLYSKVIYGKALGRKLGIPTVNQNFGRKMLIPKCGIYVTRALFGGKSYMGVSNVGRRPTVEDMGEINCETHIIDFDGDLYGEKIRIEFLARIRDEKRFSSTDELREAVAGDIEFARGYFANLKD